MMMEIKTEYVTATVDGLYDVCARVYSGEWVGPRTEAARREVRAAVLRAIRQYGLTVHTCAVRWDGGLTVR